MTQLEKALRALPSEKAPDTLELIEKLTQNVVRNPNDDKFRRIKLTNPKIAAAITNVPNAIDALKEMGWIETPDGLALPMSVSFGHGTEVMAIIEAKEDYKKAAMNPEKNGNSMANVESAGEDVFEYRDYDGEQVRLVKHLEADIHIEVFVEGASFWKGIPSFSHETGRLSCGNKGASDVPEADRERLRQYLAAMPPTPVLQLNLAG